MSQLIDNVLKTRESLFLYPFRSAFLENYIVKNNLDLFLIAF